MGGQRRLFPKPIREAVELLKDRTIDRQLEWRPDPHWSTKLALVLVTREERKARVRHLWGTWERAAAAGMERSLQKVGVTVLGGQDWDLGRYDGERFAFWFLPPAVVVAAPPKGLMEVLG